MGRIHNVCCHCILDFMLAEIRAAMLTYQSSVMLVIRIEFWPLASELITFAMNISTCEMLALIQSWFCILKCWIKK